MARIVKQEEYSAKRNQILDVARSLVYAKGYEQMTVQDILDGLEISRGAFYHYFDSKQALLEALVDRMADDAGQTLLSFVAQPDLPAIEKFRRYLDGSARLKSDQKTLIVGLLRTWYTDENARIRQKLTTGSIERTAALLAPIIRQGIEEGVFTTRFPAQVAEIIAGVALSQLDTILALLLNPQLDQAGVEELQTIQEAYVDTVERVLGAPAGSLRVFGPDAFREWFVALQPEDGAGAAESTRRKKGTKQLL